MPKDLTTLIHRAAQTIRRSKPVTLALPLANPEPEVPLIELIAKGMPVTEQTLLPRKGKGIDPRKPWMGQGTMELVPTPSLPDWETVKLQEALRKAMTQAKLGRRLTLSQQRLLAKHKLDRAMSKLRKPLGE